jgi:hypothetical protein
MIDEKDNLSRNLDIEEYKNKSLVQENYYNINISSDEDSLPTADYAMFPIVFKNNWDFKNVVSLPLLNDDECDRIISKWTDDIVVDEDINYRHCKINWIPYYKPGWEWLYDKLLQTIKKVNEDVFKFELSNPITQESIQFTKYIKGGFYAEHTDWDGESQLALRKLSWVINLSNPLDYRGGNLQVVSKQVDKSKGMIHFFPSFLRHQATKVFKGTRYSLVGWTPGPPFK